MLGGAGAGAVAPLIGVPAAHKRCAAATEATWPPAVGARRLAMDAAEDLTPTHGIGQADIGRVVVVEGNGMWVCVRVDQGCVDWIEITAATAFFGGDMLWRPPRPHASPRSCTPGASVRA